jgi:lysophospholipase L1-like esterase
MSDRSSIEEREPQTAGAGKRSSLLLNVVVLAVSLLICCFAMELALRVVFARSMDFSMEMWKYAVKLKQPVGDPRLSFAHVPNRSTFLMGAPVEINSQGLRDREYSQAKPPGVFRILMLGDSTTFGWGVREEDTAAKYLERKLNAQLPAGYDKVEVINAGVGNYDTVQEVTYYETRGRAFRPDLVVLVFFINDPEPVPVESKAFLSTSSYLIAFAINRLDGLLRFAGARPDWKHYYASLYDDDKPGFQACKQALGSLAASTQQENAKVLVAILPELREINDDSYPFKAAHQKIKDVLAADHVPSLELIDSLKDHGPESELWVTPKDDHPNAKANDLISIQLQKWVLANAKKPDAGTSHADMPNTSPPGSMAP